MSEKSGKKVKGQQSNAYFRERFRQQTLTQMERIYPPSFASQIAAAEAAAAADSQDEGEVEEMFEDIHAQPESQVVTPARSRYSDSQNKKKRGGETEDELSGLKKPSPAEKELLEYCYEGFHEGEVQDVVVNGDGDHVLAQLPRILFYPEPKHGFLTPHFHVSCSRPERNIHDRTAIPLSGCTSYVFYDKKYIRHVHAKLNGRLNVWRVESMKALTKVRLHGKTDGAINKQMVFARDSLGDVMQMIAEFEHCAISLLSIEGINKTVLEDGRSVHMATLIYQMCRYNTFQLIVLPGDSVNMIDIITRFGLRDELDYVFGKADDEKLSDTVKNRKL